MNLICHILFFLTGLSRDCYGMKILHEQFWHLAGKKIFQRNLIKNNPFRYDLVVQLCLNSNLDELFGQMWTGENKMDVLRHELASKKKSNCEVLTRGIF